MEPLQVTLTPITGSEIQSERHSALDALIEFYRAFNARDLAALAQNWAEGPAPSMDNPIGGIRRGWPDIAAGYQRLFEGPAKVNVEFFDYTHQQGSDWALFVGRERGVCRVGEQELALAIRTTRWFVHQSGRWRQLHHHGSIEFGGLLANYQSLIFGAPLEASQ